MTDNKDFHDDHDEFKFDDDMHDNHDFTDHDEQPFAQDDHAEHEQKAAKASSSKLDSLIEKLPEKLQNKRVLLATVVVVVLIILYGLFGGSDNASNNVSPANDSGVTKNAGFSNHDANLGQQKAALTDEFAVKKAPKPVVVQPPVVKNTISKNQLNQGLKAVAADIAQQNQAQLQTLNDKFSAQLNDLQTQNQVLSDSVTKLKKQVAGYKSAIHTANNKITALQQRVLAFQHGYQGAFNADGAAHYNSVAKIKAAKVVAMPTTYTVQAVVPGRAWLYGSNGQTLSIGIGDNVPGYGRVMAIDASAGTVSLTNGAVLKPGA